MLKFERQGSVSTCTINHVQIRLELAPLEVDVHGVFTPRVDYEIRVHDEVSDHNGVRTDTARITSGWVASPNWGHAEEYVATRYEEWLRRQLELVVDGTAYYNDDILLEQGEEPIVGDGWVEVVEPDAHDLDHDEPEVEIPF